MGKTTVHTATRIVYNHCITAKGELLPHVAQNIDSYLSTFWGQSTFNAACEDGASQQTLEFLLVRTVPVWKEAVNAAARGGHLHVFQWMSERPDGRGPRVTDFDSVVEVAATHGHLALLKWMHERGSKVLVRYRRNGIPMEDYVAVRRFEHGMTAALHLVARNGHLGVLKWLVSVSEDADLEHTIGMAAIGGHLDIIQWLHKTRGSVCPNWGVDVAAKYGHFKVIKWVFENQRVMCSSWAVHHAAQHGNFKIVKWLHETMSLECSSMTLCMAIKNGHLEIAKWVNENITEKRVFSFGMCIHCCCRG